LQKPNATKMWASCTVTTKQT